MYMFIYTCLKEYMFFQEKKRNCSTCTCIQIQMNTEKFVILQHLAILCLQAFFYDFFLHNEQAFFYWVLIINKPTLQRSVVVGYSTVDIWNTKSVDYQHTYSTWTRDWLRCKQVGNITLNFAAILNCKFVLVLVEEMRVWSIYAI